MLHNKIEADDDVNKGFKGVDLIGRGQGHYGR